MVHSASSRQAGMTLVEVMIALVLVPMVLGGAVMMLSSSNRARSDVSGTVDVTRKLRTVMRRLGDDLRASGVIAEDVNQNGMLDASEDGNNNGRLDSDWATTASSLTLNRLLGDATWSLPMTYRLNGTTLELERMIDADGTLQTVAIANSVSAFSVSTSGNEVTVSMTVEAQTQGGGSVAETSTITVAPRN